MHLVHAHPGVVTPQDWWLAWTFDPWVVLPIAIAALLHSTGTLRLWRDAGANRGIRTWQAWCYNAGIVTLIVALMSPLHALGGTLFSAHMLQHVLLMVVAAPLLVLGRPLIAFVWALPEPWRPGVGAAFRHPLPKGAWSVLRTPYAAWGVHAAALWIWHAPFLYEATLRSEAVHAAQHASFFGSALLFWWAALELARRTQQRQGIGVLYMFTTAVHSSVLGALLTFSLVVWYPAYAPYTATWGLAPLQDQQLGGLIMWVPAGIVYLVAALALVAAWLAVADRQTPAGPAGDRFHEATKAALPTRRVATLVVVLACAGVAASCTRPPGEDRALLEVAGGDAAAGRNLLLHYGCTSCHIVPGVRGPAGLVGPPLIHWSRRIYIAGRLPNTPDNLVHWIHSPERLVPGTAMPNVGASPQEARDMAAYLFTLR